MLTNLKQYDLATLHNTSALTGRMEPSAALPCWNQLLAVVCIEVAGVKRYA